MKKVIIPVSGGLDSVTLLHYIAKQKSYEIYPVFIQYGQKHMIELDMSSIQVSRLQAEGYDVHELKVINMEFLSKLIGASTSLMNPNMDIPDINSVNTTDSRSTTYVPYRNMIFLSVLLSYAETIGAAEIYFGSINEQEYTPSWDTTQKFTDSLNAISELNSESNIRILSPFSGLTKSEEIQLGKELLHIDYSKTWSSYGVSYNDNNEALADNENPASAERILGFARCGIQDPIQYTNSIDWEELFDKHYPLGQPPFDVKDVIEKVESNMKDLYI